MAKRGRKFRSEMPVIRQFQFGWLEAFLAVAETESFTAAAEKLGYDRTNVSRNVRALERWAGQLFFTENVPQLTDEGRDFKDTAEMILGLLENSRHIPAPAVDATSAKDIDMDRYTPKSKTP